MNTTKHITVELAAIDELVSNRFLQSTEFEHGRSLADLIIGRASTATLGPQITTSLIGEGIFLTGAKTTSDSRYLVIDIEQSRIFDGLSDADSLFVFQKLLRFAKKIWQGLTMNFAERIISGSSKAVLFPFRGFVQTPYRVVIEREPNAERLEKRGDKGKFLLAYKAGRESGEASKEVAAFTNFRKVYESIAELRQQLSSQPTKNDVRDGVDQLKVVELPSPESFGPSSMFRRFDDWLPLLTQQQRKFVETPIVGSYRIEGAAGTGKTLCLMLKAMSALRHARDKDEEMHIVFVTHSDATKRSIAEVLSVIDEDVFLGANRKEVTRSLKVCTLSELCAEQLRQAISETEFIDRDAMESKSLQLLYISEAYDEVIAKEFAAHERFLSPAFATFLRTEEPWKVAEMLQHEISVVIKGRASEDLDRYKKIEPLRYGLPIITIADKGFVYGVFRSYQSKLSDVGQFDTDDVILTTMGQLDTPIWRRRRLREAYDAVFVDETHLFNINELHLFHFFSKKEGPYPIIYSVDRSQAVGDRGWTTGDIAASLSNENSDSSREAKVRTVFRSSVEIVNLAFSILSSGATLFTNFENPVDMTASAFTADDERLAAPPRYWMAATEEALIEAAFTRAETLVKELGCRRSELLLVTLDTGLLNKLQEFATSKNKPHLLLKKRGDALAVESARQSGQLILAHADYVGGLEFAAVILVGVDEGRVPPRSEEKESSRNFLSYAAHNRLYVAVTRARYRVELLGEKARGPSKIIEPAIKADIIRVEDL